MHGIKSKKTDAGLVNPRNTLRERWWNWYGRDRLWSRRLNLCWSAAKSASIRSVFRLYCEAGLVLRRRVGKRVVRADVDRELGVNKHTSYDWQTKLADLSEGNRMGLVWPSENTCAGCMQGAVQGLGARKPAIRLPGACVCAVAMEWVMRESQACESRTSRSRTDMGAVKVTLTVVCASEAQRSYPRRT